MLEEKTTQVPGGEGFALRIGAGEFLTIVNDVGSQVCDFVAVQMAPTRETLSPTHTRSILRRSRLRVGDALHSRNRTPMFELVTDTSGCHDMTLAMCDREHYSQVFGQKDHRNCHDNIRSCLRDAGVELTELPDPINWFQDTPLDLSGNWVMKPSPARAGDKVVLRALMDSTIAVSACPQDMNPINGGAPSSISLVVSGASALGSGR